MTDSRYPATQAANVVLAIALVTALILGYVGYSTLRSGNAIGWLLLVLGVLPLLLALFIRTWLRSPRS